MLFLFLIIVGGPIVLMVIAQAFAARRRRRAGVVLAHLHQAVRMNLPLPEMLHAAADSERGTTRRRLDWLAFRLDRGDGLSDAVRDTVPELDDRAVRLLSVGEWAGRLDATLGYLVEKHAPINDDHGRVRIEGFYVVMVLMMVAAAVAGMTALIIPKFHEIFKDFGTELPDVTRAMVGFADFAARDTPIASLLAFVIVVGYGLGVLAIFEHWFVGRVPWGAPARALGATVGSVIPGIGSIPRDRALAQVCFVLGEATRSGLRLDSAIEETAHLKMPSVWRGRVAAFGENVRSGMEPGEAARAAKMPGIVCGMLGPAARTGDTAGAFDFLARYFDQRFSRAAALLRGAMIPTAVLSLGLVVGLTVVAMIMPLVALIDGVIGSTGL